MENKSMDDILQEITSMDHLLGKSNRILDLPERESLTSPGLLAALDIASKSQIPSPPIVTIAGWTIAKITEKINAEKNRKAKEQAYIVLKDYYQALAVKQTQLAKKREEELRILRDLKMQDDKKREELEGKIQELESILCAIEKKLA